MPIGVTGAVALGSAAIGAGASIYGSSQAAGAAGKSADEQAKANNFNNLRMNPFVTAGADALGTQKNQIDNFYPQIAPFAANAINATPTGADLPGQMSEDQLVATPGYKFALSQGLQSVQNSAAARGLGISGAALKGAATYATGLADSTYQNQFNNAQTNFGDKQTQFGDANTTFQNALGMNNQVFNQNNARVTMGESGAANAGSTNAYAAGNIGNALSQAGQYQAAGATGVGNALAGGANNYLSMQYLKQLQQPTGYSGGGAAQNADALAYGAAQNAQPGVYGPGY